MDERPFRQATRQGAFATLQDFLPRAGADYASRRDFDLGPGKHQNVSLLSPCIRHRLILETEVLEAVLAQHGAASATPFIEEVFWRSYFKGWLEHHPTVWTDYRVDVRALVDTLETDAGLRERYETALNARTGIDCFDAWVSELVTTGYLHNHARMWFASIWIYTLELPWQLGADFFYRHLADGDPASNTLSWRWVCGLHTRGKTYLARATNIVSYTGGRFLPGGRLARNAPPLTETRVHALRPLPKAQALPAGGRFGLLVTEDDCALETLEPVCAPVAVMGATSTASRSPLPVGAVAHDFAMRAVADGTERVAIRYGIPAQSVRGEDWGSALVAWSRSCRLDAVVTAYAPAGPAAERFARARRALAEQGVELVQARRRYDDCMWPHATRGYFRLKSCIPEVLEQLGLTGIAQKPPRTCG
jgi:deoxyribodipyrimidine photo-lyase